MSDGGTFLNPYTFVPAFPRDTSHGVLGNGSPLGRDPGKPGSGSGRDRLHRDRWTGRIGVTLTVETPLLLLDTARGTPPAEGADGHRVYPVRLRNGRPHLPATSVKGMLRAAYEAVTNSRFGIFDGHDTRLGFRRSADDALEMVPVRVESEGVLVKYQVVPLEMYDKRTGESIHSPEDQEVLRHMEPLLAVIAKDPRRGFKVVRRFARSGSRELSPQMGEQLVEGFAYITGPNIEGKQFERFFYTERRGMGKRQPLPLAREWSALVADWELLIQSYRDAHNDKELYERVTSDGRVAEPGERIGAGPGQLAWSPHIYDEKWLKLEPGTFCYAFCKERKSNGANVVKEVAGLYPVLVPRDLYEVAPSKLLHDSLAPTTDIEKLSPADRVFGWAAPRASGVRPAAYRGRLRVGPVTCDQDAEQAVKRFDGDGLPLAILSRPKPQQGRFYLAESQHRPDRPIRDGISKEQLYQPGQGLRGRKVYWHHAGLNWREHWSEGQGKIDPTQVRVGVNYREYRRPDASPADGTSQSRDGKQRYETDRAEQQRDTQNRSVKGWVQPRTTFRFSVEVRDLDEHELGALAWLLTLPQGHFHRLGLGRPLGFGSVRLDVDEENTELHSGEDYAAYYRDLSGTLPRRKSVKTLQSACDSFTGMVEGIPSLVAIREAMLAVSRGTPGVPVHYPRTQPEWWSGNASPPPDPQGGNYAWFTENERPEDKEIAQGRGRSLPSPTDPGVPLIVYREKKDDKGKGVQSTSRSGGGGKGRKNGGSR
ncbi:TIGR03986 family CRISPR-associated RAMP protein [Streptosporangium sp. NPDC087985]|uniref:TIGR03986 family type III CRISPR-associated RAMP protein n=1 Tax=Streptosporangium sp. NPDC087985 TaxID=3366196 RepID=UPI003810F503